MLVFLKFNLTYLDTGATYRCVAKKFLDEKVEYKDEEKIAKILKLVTFFLQKHTKFKIFL